MINLWFMRFIDRYSADGQFFASSPMMLIGVNYQRNFKFVMHRIAVTVWG